MSWDSKYPNFDIVTIEGKNVKVYSDLSHSTTIGLDEEVSNAEWDGGELNITLRSGKVRRYMDRVSYITI